MKKIHTKNECSKSVFPYVAFINDDDYFQRPEILNGLDKRTITKIRCERPSDTETNGTSLFDLTDLMSEIPVAAFFDCTTFEGNIRKSLLELAFPFLSIRGTYTCCGLALLRERNSPEDSVFLQWVATLSKRLLWSLPDRRPAAILSSSTADEQVWHHLDGISITNDSILFSKYANTQKEPYGVRVGNVSEIAAQYREVLPAQSYERSDPVVFDCPDYLEHRLQKVVRSGPAISPPGIVAVIPEAVVYGDGIVEAEHRYLVRESLINVENDLIISFFRRVSAGNYISLDWARNVLHLADKSVVLFKQPWDGNYGHYLVESLPRLGLIEKLYDLKELKFVVKSWQKEMIPLYIETLAWFGIDQENIIVTNGDPIFIENLVYATPVSKHPFVKSPFVISFLESLGSKIKSKFPEQASLGPQKVYLSRQKYKGTRKLLNEPEILQVLLDRGYVVSYPEQLSFAEQVLLMANVKYIVGDLGAAMTNAVFAERGVRMLALVSQYMADDFFWDIVAQKKGKYFSLHGLADDPSKLSRSDFTVDLKRFVEVLDLMENEK